MSEFVPDEFLTLSDAVDYAGHCLFKPDWTEREIRQLRRSPPKRMLRRLEIAIGKLRNLMASEHVQPIALANNGERFRVPISVWLSTGGRAVFNTGILPLGNLRESLRAKQEGTLVRRILVPKDQLRAAFDRADVNIENSRPKKYSEKALRERYKEYVEENENAGNLPPSRTDDVAAMKQRVGEGVPREAVRDLRRKFAPAHWRDHGRRKTGGK